MYYRVFAAISCQMAVVVLWPAAAPAQSGLTVWPGLGYASTEGNVTLGKSVKQLGAQLGLPIVPVAIRGDVVLFGGKYVREALSYVVNAVVRMPVPFIQPFAIAGRGRYATSLTTKANGWNYGVGVRLGSGRFGVFAEMRRHAPIGRSITVAGVTF